MNKSPHLDKDWLYQKYIVERLSTYEIGRLVNRDPKRIYEKLIDFGIQTRPRGLNLKGKDHWTQKGIPNAFLGKHHSAETRKILSEKASIPKPWLRGSRNGMYKKNGDSNPNYKDGSSPERQRLYAGSEWKEVQRQVYKRDNYHCVRCGSPKRGWRGLHAHHIKSWAGNPELRFKLSNIVTLCKDCHNWVHSRANNKMEYLA